MPLFEQVADAYNPKSIPSPHAVGRFASERKPLEEAGLNGLSCLFFVTYDT